MGNDSPKIISVFWRCSLKSSNRGRRGIVVKLTRSERRRLEKISRKTRDAGMKRRTQTIILRAQGWTYRQIAAAVGCAHATVGCLLGRWQQHGEAALYDRREDNGCLKADEDFLQCLRSALENTPRQYNWKRPTWTQELLILVMKRISGVEVSTSTMSVALRKIGARRGRPRPVVACPWPRWKRNRCLHQIRRIVQTSKPGEVVLYEDEVDIHLNPKIGYDWMLPAQQRVVVTPGQNHKRYVAGVLNARTGEITYVTGRHKNSLLFIQLCHQLLKEYAGVNVIHLILDNFKIHKSEQTLKYLNSLKGKVQLHFLPPYCPQNNRIERYWQELHANVTRNHTYKTIHGLMSGIRAYLRKFRRCCATAFDIAA